jgi:hypothetical protein
MNEAVLLSRGSIVQSYSVEAYIPLPFFFHFLHLLVSATDPDDC